MVGCNILILSILIFACFVQVDLLEDGSEEHSSNDILMLDDTPMKFPDDEDQSDEESSEVTDLDVKVSLPSLTTEVMPEPTVVAGYGLSDGGKTKLGTSVTTGIGLAALLETIDKRLEHVVRRQA